MNIKKDILKMPYYSFRTVEDSVQPIEVKKLRERLNVSQSSLARIFGISVKTVEKWESGDNPIKGTAAKLVYILNKQPEIINLIYSFEEIDPNNEKKAKKQKSHHEVIG